MRWQKYTLTGYYLSHLDAVKSHKTLLMRFILMVFDILLYLGLTIFIYYTIAWRMIAPYERGFHCNDVSIQRPLYENSVPTTVLLSITLAGPFFIIFFANVFSREWRKALEVLHDHLDGVIRITTFVYLDYLFGFFLLTLFLDLIKCAVGRLRPNFMEMCKLPDNITAACAADPSKYIEDFTCTSSWKRSRNARMSFPSGHSAAAAFSLLFLYFFLKQTYRYAESRTLHLKLFRIIVMAFFIPFSIYCCLSRITDFWHFPTDVASGILFAGIVFYFTLRKYT